MLRSIVSIIGLILIAGSLLVIVPIMWIPNTFLHAVVPVLAPLHQRIACVDGETIAYESVTDQDGVSETHFRCVNERGVERDVDDALLTPAYYAYGTLCLGGLLWLVPLVITLRKGLRGEHGAELQNALQTGFQQTRAGLSQMGESSTPTAVSADPSGQSEGVRQQLSAIEDLRRKGMINEEAYAEARKRILGTE